MDWIAILTQACTCDAHADERWDAPPRDLEQALVDEGMPRAFVKTVPLGQTQDIETMAVSYTHLTLPTSDLV